MFIFFLLLILLVNISVAQNINDIPESPINDYFKSLKIQGILPEYDDIVLPLSIKKINYLIEKIDRKRDELSSLDFEKLSLFKKRYSYLNDSYDETISVFGVRGSSFSDFFHSDYPVYFYDYRDSLFLFTLNPLLSYRNLTDFRDHKQPFSASLFGYGGEVSLSYSDWLGIKFNAWNGALIGNRETASLDSRVAQSYTFNTIHFNSPQLNYFDGTEGYLFIEKDIYSFQFGRERLLWGSGVINKTVLDKTPPIFDFLKFNLSYKRVTFDFLHGWLVEKPYSIYIDSTKDYGKTKASKYIAISRFGYKPFDNLFLGVTQSIIYSNRPFEAAYLTPFLFWESAQRSMNDMDNSFLGFDVRYFPVKGALISSSITFDDINFDYWLKGEWETSNNGVVIQLGTHLTRPILPDFLELKLEYLHIRPYTYSHYGFETALSYTNNGYLLGADVQPNSIMYSLLVDFFVTSKLLFRFGLDYMKHGKNSYDSTGIMIKNVGGDVFRSTNSLTGYFSRLLDGELEIENKFKLLINYDYSYNLKFDMILLYLQNKFMGNKLQDFILALTIRFNKQLLHF